MSRERWQENDVFVLSVGAQTPVGRTALKAAAAVRCGISAYQEHEFMIDRRGEPMVVAQADWLPPAMLLQDRMVHFATNSLREALSGLEKLIGHDPFPVLFTLSATTLTEELARESIAQQVLKKLSNVGMNVRGTILTEGNAIGALAIQRGADWLRQGKGSVVAIVGVDSQLSPETLESIDFAGRLHSVNNSWGFTPGEGAGAVVLTTGGELNRLQAIPLAQLAACSIGKESKLLGTKTVCIGEGLTEAFRGSLSEENQVAHSYCDLNGETYRADEFGFAVCRTREGFKDAGSFTAAAECWGDVGAATVPLQVALATSAWSRGYAKGASVFCWSSSATSPLRGALRLSNYWRQAELI